jgi:isochorismate synthase
MEAALGVATGGAFQQRVEHALAAIASQELEKVVLATSCSLELPAAPDPIGVLQVLRAQQPGCCHFLLSPGAGVAFMGASPERLVSVQGRSLKTVALAGSAPRGSDTAADRALGDELLASDKERREHSLVVDAICRELGESAPANLPSPRLRRLATLQHLETEIRAVVPPGTSVLDWAARLHPTPALGGAPRDRARRLIHDLEGDNRGLYGGAVGWVDRPGDGDLCVAIRSMLLRGKTVTAFAGAGIVQGSDPAREADEVRSKLRVTLQALVGVSAASGRSPSAAARSRTD